MLLKANACLAMQLATNGGPLYPNLTGIGSRQTVAGILVNTDDPKYANEGTVEDNLKTMDQRSAEG